MSAALYGYLTESIGKRDLKSSLERRLKPPDCDLVVILSGRYSSWVLVIRGATMWNHNQLIQNGNWVPSYGKSPANRLGSKRAVAASWDFPHIDPLPQLPKFVHRGHPETRIKRWVWSVRGWLGFEPLAGPSYPTN